MRIIRARGSLRLALALLALTLLAGVPAALAEAGESAFSAPLLLNLFNVTIESPEAAFKESLRSSPAPRLVPGWEILPDGSARYGDSRLSVVIKNPCPDGTIHTPVALPGRRR